MQSNRRIDRVSTKSLNTVLQRPAQPRVEPKPASLPAGGYNGAFEKAFADVFGVAK